MPIKELNTLAVWQNALPFSLLSLYRLEHFHPLVSFILVFFHAIHFYNQQYQRSTIICLHVQVNRKCFLKYFKRTVLVLNRLCHVESFSIIHLRYQKDRIRQRKPTLSEIFQFHSFK